MDIAVSTAIDMENLHDTISELEGVEVISKSLIEAIEREEAKVIGLDYKSSCVDGWGQDLVIYGEGESYTLLQ